MNEVKKIVGKLAKKVRVSADGRVEIVHTDNRNNLMSCLLGAGLRGGPRGWEKPHA